MSKARQKVAMVTGAGGGIGSAIAAELAATGFLVIASDIETHPNLASVVEGIKKTGGNAIELRADIAKAEHWDAIVEAAWKSGGGLDCLVNNAGISVKTRGDMLDVTPESFDRLIDINLRGTFFLSQTVARRMLSEQSPHFRSIITISSANAVAASLDRAEYCISKSALSMVVQLFALRLAEAGINAYEIRPGVIRTSMTAVAQSKYDGRYAQGFTPINRWGEPRDIARGIAALAEGHFGFSTGEIINLDGGLHIAKL